MGYILSLEGSALPASGACKKCAPQTYSLNPLAPEGCIECPKTATCINGGKPIFGASKVAGEIELDLPAGSGPDAIRQALAEKLKVDVSTIVLPASSQGHRAVQNVTFEIYGEPSQIDSLAQSLSTMPGVVVTGSPEAAGQTSRPGEVWEEVNGVFMLRKCPPGFKLIDTTIELQECSPCGPTKYIIEGSTDCVDCPDGASCPDGAKFEPNVAGSVWAVETDADGVKYNRVSACPAGYALVRTGNNPLADKCERCPGTQQHGYNLDVAQWSAPGPMGLGDFCKPCPLPIGTYMTCVRDPWLALS